MQQYYQGAGEEEEEEELYDKVPRNIDELTEYWTSFKQSSQYPLYALILASQADEEVVSLVSNHRAELAEISGENCCFIYFRDLERAKMLTPFDYAEHAQWVYPLVRLINLDLGTLPCILFFEDILSGNYAYIGLKGKSVSEIIHLTRELFGYIKQHSRRRNLNALRSFNRAQRMQVARDVISRNIFQMGQDLVIEFLKSLVKTP
jgi:hypothetical protein